MRKKKNRISLEILIQTIRYSTFSIRYKQINSHQNSNESKTRGFFFLDLS